VNERAINGSSTLRKTVLMLHFSHDLLQLMMIRPLDDPVKQIFIHHLNRFM